MSRFGRRVLLGGAGLIGLAGVSGCVSIPTSGGIEQVSSQPRQSDPSVAVDPAPPQPGATPLSVVSGLLQAMAYNVSDYAIAREYLTTDARARWRPATGVQVFADDYFPTGTDESAQLQAPLVGLIGADGSYRPAAGELTIDFGLVRENDEWRVGTPPKGLLVSQFDFAQYYQSFNMYFYEPGMQCLVPDPVFQAGGDQTATALIRRLLQGPSDWLTAGVVSALPAQTQLNVSAPVNAAGVVEVSFSDAVSGLGDQQRSQLAAQVLWTLRQLDGVTGARLLMNGVPWSVPGADPDGVIAVGAVEFDGPIPSQVSSALIAAHPGGVLRVEETGTTPVDGPWAGVKGITSMALANAGDPLAAVVGGTLLTGALSEQPAQVLTGQRLLRPQFSRFRELWTIDARDNGAVVWRALDGKTQRVSAPSLNDGRVIAFRLAPDGVRMAVLRQRGSTIALGMVLVNRTKAQPVLEGWRTVPLYLPQRDQVAQLVDLAWLNATSLMVLGSVDRSAPLGPYITSQDGATTQSAGNPDQWNATLLAASPREPASPRDLNVLRAVLRGSGGRVFRYEDDFTWVQVTDGVTTLAFPG